MTTSDISQERFDQLLAEIMDESVASALLSIPGVYEAVSEHFNNDVLDRYEQEKTNDDDDDNDDDDEVIEPEDQTQGDVLGDDDDERPTP
jgi:hypothetical protein